MRELLVATRNKHKIPGMLAGLKDVPFKIVSLNDTDIPTDYVPDEPGSTYEAHAAIKAILYGKKSGKLTIADDSGIEVDALNGWPGVVSATWLKGTDEERLLGLLSKMKAIPEGKRGAQYRSVICMYDPDTDKVRFAEGTNRGRLLTEITGTNPFGYNRGFFSDDLQKSFGEVGDEEIARVSHRARALEKAKEILVAEFA
jgi:XTP/dITP diphosphohydrolase